MPFHFTIQSATARDLQGGDFSGQKETDHCRGSDEISYCSLSPSSSILVRKRGRCFSWLAGQWISPSLEISVSRSVLPYWDFAWNTTSATNKLHKTTTAFSISMLCSWAEPRYPKAFYLLQYVDVIKKVLWSEADPWAPATCSEFDVGVEGLQTMTNPLHRSLHYLYTRLLAYKSIPLKSMEYMWWFFLSRLLNFSSKRNLIRDILTFST